MYSIDHLKRQAKTHACDPLAYEAKLTLLCWVLNKPFTFLMTNGDYVLSDHEYQAWQMGDKRLNDGEPLAYVLGSQAFWGREFLVNQHTLIPRPDSERMIDVVLEFIRSANLNAPTILDLGTGSGCLAITLAKEVPNAQVLAVDFCRQALDVATKNATWLQADNCQFLQSDWFAKVVGQFDIIISNPPYIAADDEHLPKLSAEPISALVAENDGLADMIRIIQDACDFLKQGGLLAIEHGHTQGQAVAKLFIKSGFDKVQTIKDYGGNDRLTMGIWG